MSTHWFPAGLLGLVGVGVLSASACTSSTYLRATRPYAEAIAAGTAAFVEELELAGAMCQRRIEMDQLRHLIEGSTNQIIGWEAHCEQIALATKVQRRAASLLLAYAQALQQLADGVTYQGTGLGDAAGGTADLIRRFAGASSPEAAYASALGPPLTQLAEFLLTQSASVEIKRRIDESAPAVEAMLGAMAAYVKATDAQLLVYEHEVTKLLADAEARLRVDPQAGGNPERFRKVPPMEAFAFVHEAAGLKASLSISHQKQAALTEAIASLSAAEAKLKRAGDRDDEELKQVVTDAVNAAQAIRDFLNTRSPME